MGWNNPDVPWRELERRLSGRGGEPPNQQRPREMRTGWPDGGDGPAFSRKRERYEPDRRPEPPPGPVVPYAELHCHSSYSFLDGASNPEALVEEAVRLGLSALAVTDHDGFYGSVRFAEAAQEYPASARCTGPSCRSGSPCRSRASPTPRAATCWCSPAAWRAITGWPGRSPRRSCAATRRGARSTTSRSWPSTDATTGTSSPAAARVWCDRRLPTVVQKRLACAPTDSRHCSVTTRWPSSSPTTGIPATAWSTTRWPSWPPTTGCPRWPPTTSTSRVHPTAGSPRPSRPSGPGAASPSSTAGCPRRARRSSGREQRCCIRFSRYPGAVERTVEHRGGSLPSTCTRRPRGCRSSRCRPATRR